MSKLLSRAHTGDCRFVVCETAAPRRGEPLDLFGGQRICGEPAIHPTSYCAVHKALYYVRTGDPAREPSDLHRRPMPPQIDKQPELTEVIR